MKSTNWPPREPAPGRRAIQAAVGAALVVAVVALGVVAVVRVGVGVVRAWFDPGAGRAGA